MLTAAQVRGTDRRRRPAPSLRQQYDEYVMQRIESYKNSVPREELLRLGGEAVAEMHAGAEGQFVLTEILMLDSVDELIRRRLRIPGFDKWRRQSVDRRNAQREPTHWGLGRGSAVAALLPRLEPSDNALVVGGGAEACVYLLCAHQVTVTFLGGEIGTVERVESTVEGESLGSRFDAYVVQFGGWLPPLEPLDLVVLDLATIGELEAAIRLDLIRDMQRLTRVGGVHVLLGARGGMAPEALRSLYPGWRADEAGARKGARRGGLVLARPSTDASAGSGEEAHAGLRRARG
jgi:hypothetical protein